MTAKRKYYRARQKRVCFHFQYSSSQLMTILHQKYDARGLAIHEGEKECQRQLTIDFMSEESHDPEDNQTVVVHPLQWRSKLSNYCIARKFCLELNLAIRVFWKSKNFYCANVYQLIFSSSSKKVLIFRNPKTFLSQMSIT